MNEAARITHYLASGGLFNPELMEHEKVRDLLIDCRNNMNPTPQNVTSRYTRNLIIKGQNNEFHLSNIKRESHFIDKVWIANYYVAEVLQGGLSKTGVGATPEQSVMNCLVKYGVTFR